VRLRAATAGLPARRDGAAFQGERVGDVDEIVFLPGLVLRRLDLVVVVAGIQAAAAGGDFDRNGCDAGRGCDRGDGAGDLVGGGPGYRSSKQEIAEI
jgi:hypothetical protein